MLFTSNLGYDRILRHRNRLQRLGEGTKVEERQNQPSLEKYDLSILTNAPKTARENKHVLRN